MTTLIKLYTLNKCCLFHVNYTFKGCQKRKKNLFSEHIFSLPSYLIFRKCDDVGQLLAPADLIEEGLVTDVFTRVTVQPPLLRRGVHFCPDVVYASDRQRRNRKRKTKAKFIKPRLPITIYKRLR